MGALKSSVDVVLRPVYVPPSHQIQSAHKEHIKMCSHKKLHFKMSLSYYKRESQIDIIAAANAVSVHYHHTCHHDSRHGS